MRAEPEGQQSIELVFHNIHEHGVGIIDRWLAAVEEGTGGGVRFSRTGGEDAALIRAADVIRDVPAAATQYPLLGLVQLPLLFPDAAAGSRVLAQLYEEFSELREELNDTKIVGLSIGAPMAIFTTRAWGPVRTLADLRGARIRSLPVIDGALRALGAEPVHVPYLDIAGQMWEGTLDATVLGVLPAHQFRLADGTALHCLRTGRASITMHPMRTYMKWESWRKLPQSYRDVIDSLGPAGAACWFARESGRDADAHFEEALGEFEVTTFTSKQVEELRQTIQPEVEKVLNAAGAQGRPARRFYERMVELASRYTT
jgi:TRAP-type C4-dicarboxylate transport system substrate-binding protein